MIYLSEHDIRNDIIQKLLMYIFGEISNLNIIIFIIGTPNILLKFNNQIEDQLPEMMKIVID